jgi:hypothetical protein
MAVASPPVLAFANSAVARHPQDHASWFVRESFNEAELFVEWAVDMIRDARDKCSLIHSDRESDLHRDLAAVA